MKIIQLDRKRVAGLTIALLFLVLLTIHRTQISIEKMFLSITSRHNMGTPERPTAMLDTARQITSHSRTVMVAVVNDAYLPFAYSWLCNTRDMGIHKMILFITADDQTAETLKRDWPEVSVASMGVNTLKGDRKFGHAGYLRVNVKRHQFIYELLKDGFEMLHFEVDCVWLKNPLPFLQGHSGYDLLVNQVSNIEDYNSGFVYVFNTERSIEVWRLLAQRMTELADQIAWLKDGANVKIENNDQPFWSEIIRNRVPGIKLKVLTLDIFPDGVWYKWSDEKRKNASNAFLINNNWIAGNANKKARAKEWGHWFIDDDMNCKMDLVHKVVRHS